MKPAPPVTSKLREDEEVAKPEELCISLSLICHPERSEGSLAISPRGERKLSQMFRFAQHDKTTKEGAA